MAKTPSSEPKEGEATPEPDVKTETTTDSAVAAPDTPATPAKQICGVIMPISVIDDCDVAHWAEVRSILEDAIKSAGLIPKMVFEADEVGIIHNRIVENIYYNPIVVCDVSCRNANVMFELGMRLAFDKPTIIIKDDKTAYPFDASPIEYVGYRRDLRFNSVLEFKKELIKKLTGTLKKADEDTEYSPFLKHFGKFTVKGIESKEVSKEDYIISELKEMNQLLASQMGSILNRPAINELDITDQTGKRAHIVDSEAARQSLIEYVFLEKTIESGGIPARKIDALFDSVVAGITGNKQATISQRMRQILVDLHSDGRNRTKDIIDSLMITYGIS